MILEDEQELKLVKTFLLNYIKYNKISTLDLVEHYFNYCKEEGFYSNFVHFAESITEGNEAKLESGDTVESLELPSFAD